MKIWGTLFIILWNILSILLLLTLKIISIILILPIYIIMLLLALFSPITYLASFLYGVFYIFFIVTAFYSGLIMKDPLGGILTIIFLSIPLIICGSVSLLGMEAAAKLIGFLGSIVTLPISCLFIHRHGKTNYSSEDNFYSNSFNGAYNNNYEQSPQEELSFFQNCHTLDEVKDCYRKLVKIYHPDSSMGNAKMFEIIQQEYENVLKKYV